MDWLKNIWGKDVALTVGEFPVIKLPVWSLLAGYYAYQGAWDKLGALVKQYLVGA